MELRLDSCLFGPRMKNSDIFWAWALNTELSSYLCIFKSLTNFRPQTRRRVVPSSLQPRPFDFLWQRARNYGHFGQMARILVFARFCGLTNSTVCEYIVNILLSGLYMDYVIVGTGVNSTPQTRYKTAS